MNAGSARLAGSREALLALLVLSLTFLNFGHMNAVFAAGGRVVVTGTSICGDHDPTAAGEHFACHACRQHAPALPEPPATAEPIVFCIVPVVYAVAPAAWVEPSSQRRPRPRGPPSVV